MNITINSVKFKTDVKLEEFIHDKLNKLNNLYEEIQSSEVILKLDKDEQKENKITEIKLIVKGSEMFAKKRSKSFEEGTDLVVDALKKQLIKHKDKSKNV
jgi:putative sigma-54 modulation protein